MRRPQSQVVIISSEFPPEPGGIGTHAFQIAHGIQRAGLAVSVLCPTRGDASTTSAFDGRQPFAVLRFNESRWKPLSVAGRYRAALTTCRDQKPRCILATGRSGVLIGYVVSRALGIRLVVVGHGGDFTMGGSLARRLFHHAFGRADSGIVVSRYTRDLMLGCGVRGDSVTVIQNGADARRFSGSADCGDLKTRLGLDGKRVILTVGSVTERKAQDVVIRALPSVLKSVPEVVYVAAGPPVKAREYGRLAEELGVAGSVQFVGAVPDEELPKYYALANVVALTSRIDSQGDREGFGIALVEAGLMRKPVVGTRGCGIEDAVADGETGLLVDMDAPEQTAEALVRLLSDRNFAKRLGENGRSRALSEFTWDRCTERTLEVIKAGVRSDSKPLESLEPAA